MTIHSWLDPARRDCATSAQVCGAVVHGLGATAEGSTVSLHGSSGARYGLITPPIVDISPKNGTGKIAFVPLGSFVVVPRDCAGHSGR